MIVACLSLRAFVIPTTLKTIKFNKVEALRFRYNLAHLSAALNICGELVRDVEIG
eukprot:SAG11_NODE_1370_length_5096_cov_2.366620_7_plen_55_part_00